MSKAMSAERVARVNESINKLPEPLAQRVRDILRERLGS